MLVLGSRYRFIPIELERLEKKYGLKPRFLTEISIDAIEKARQKEDVQIIILNTDQHPSKEIVSYLTALELEGVEFYTIEHFLEKYLHKIYIPKNVKKLDFLDEIKPYCTLRYLFKRLVDYIGASTLAILTAPVMLYAAYRIKKESPGGPIIYRQKRVGLHGREFVCYKFRSMIPDAEKERPRFASKEDPRIFKWGAFMRKTRIDELPQLWNVLRGDMHLIGPRPERRYWIEEFEKRIPYYNLRHLVKPGITGWAQVSYTYGTGVEGAYQKLMYDLYYIKNWSLRLEITIVFKTVKIMLTKAGV